MGRQTKFFVAAIVVVMLVGTTGSAPAQDEGFKVGVVSIDRVQQEYVDLQSEQQDLEKWLGAQHGFFNALTDYIFLSSENFDEVRTLLKKTEPSDEEKARLAELRTISDDKDGRFRELGAKTERTAQEEDEFNSLQDIFKARTLALDEMWKKTLAELSGLRETAVKTLMDKVKEAIAVEAQAQGMSRVVDADATVFGGTDITEDVLKRLNVAAAPAAAPAPAPAAAPAPAPAEAPAEGGGQ
jgi:Skp family chaperone for outer membrane proteins